VVSTDADAAEAEGRRASQRAERARSGTGPEPTISTFDLDDAWRLHPQVSIRPERFGGLLYHFGTRRLSFVKSPTLLGVLTALDTAPSARAACSAAGVGEAELGRYRSALAGLAGSDMICQRSGT
jgi:putative mycofactocin binding protein MftB